MVAGYLGSLGAMLPMRRWFFWPECHNGHGVMMPKRWRWTQRSTLAFTLFYWAAALYWLTMTLAFFVLAIADESWLFAAVAITAGILFPLAWYFEVFRCSVCGEQRTRRQLLHHGA